MAAFDYEALDPAGRRKRGIISADSARLARRELRRKKLLPVKVEPAERQDAAAGRFAGFSLRKMANRDLSLVTRQLATLLEAGAPVEEALNTVAMQADKQPVRKTMLAVRNGVVEGYRLSEALAQQKGTFSPLYRSMVAAGEASGSLGSVLERLADHLEKSQKMRSKVTTALVYPIFLAVTATIVVIALMTFVVPKVVEQFDTFGQDLPLLTRIMIGLSDAMQAYGLGILMILVIGVLLFVQALRREAFRLRVDQLVLRLPLAGKLVRELHAARLARTLGTLIASGVPVLEGLTAARNTVQNRVMKDALNQVVTSVREGGGLGNALRRTGAFPPLVAYMAAVGENSGRLDVMLAKAADYLESEFETFTASVLSLLEPAIIVVMGAIVTLIVLAILLPILQLNTMTLL